MCRFKSGIVMRNGDLLTSPYTDKHEDLITLHNIKDNGNDGFVRVEYVPLGKDYELDNYELRVDESIVPKWFEDIREDIIRKFHQLIKNMIITTDRDLILGGQWIIKDGVIDLINFANIVSIHRGTVKNIRRGTVRDIWGGTVRDIHRGTVENIHRGTVKNIHGGTVENIYGGTVEDIWGSTVRDIHGGTVEDIWGGTVENIHENTVLNDRREK